MAAGVGAPSTVLEYSMTNFDSAAQESAVTTDSIDLSDRERRALEQFLTVTPEIGRARGADELVIVTSASGREYLVDVDCGRCQRRDGLVCPDQEYNLDDSEVCKHVIRARVATGKRPVSSAELAAADVDPQLGEHASGPAVVTSDGGMIVAGDDAEIIDEDDGRLEGPLPEFNKYGNYTGEDYWRCGDCGAEAMRRKDLDDCCEGAR